MLEHMIGSGELSLLFVAFICSLPLTTYFLLRSNHVGNYRWTSALQWSGHKAFNKEELREWRVNGELAGYTRAASGLTFATILGAGHMVSPLSSTQSLR
jgi:carboxypeptidase C (cathepsin A)